MPIERAAVINTIARIRSVIKAMLVTPRLEMLIACLSSRPQGGRR